VAAWKVLVFHVNVVLLGTTVPSAQIAQTIASYGLEDVVAEIDGVVPQGNRRGEVATVSYATALVWLHGEVELIGFPVPQIWYLISSPPPGLPSFAGLTKR